MQQPRLWKKYAAVRPKEKHHVRKVNSTQPIQQITQDILFVFWINRMNKTSVVKIKKCFLKENWCKVRQSQPKFFVITKILVWKVSAEVFCIEAEGKNNRQTERPSNCGIVWIMITLSWPKVYLLCEWYHAQPWSFC